MILPSYSAISFSSKSEHLAALYDAFKLIVDTYDQTDIMDDVAIKIQVTEDTFIFPYDVAQFAKEVMNRIAENEI